jgi:hypothetical protein
MPQISEEQRYVQNLLDAAEEVQGPLLDCHRTGNLIVDIDEGRIHELRFFRSRRLLHP